MHAACWRISLILPRLLLLFLLSMAHHHPPRLACQLLSLTLARRTVAQSCHAMNLPFMLHSTRVPRTGTTNVWTVLPTFVRFSTSKTASFGGKGKRRPNASSSFASPSTEISGDTSLKVLARSDPKKPAKETPQLRQLRKDLNHPPRQATTKELAAASARYLASSTKVSWNPDMDKQLLELYRARIAWRDIDLEMGLPYSACHHRFHTALDPNLQSWLLPNGQPNEDMLRYLIYLRDQEKLQFSDIAKLELMREPWPIPDSTLETKPVQQKVPLEGREDTFLPIHKVAIVQKYTAYRSFLNRTKNEGHHARLLEAIQRGVELYGENWTRVAAFADSRMNNWLDRERRASKDKQEGGVSSETIMAITTDPSVAETLYKGSLKHGSRWGLEDDLVMTRRVIDLYRKVSKTRRIIGPPSKDISTAEELDAPLAKEEIWENIALTLGNHTPQQCQRRWKDLHNTEDKDKSSQTTSWHRFERFQFWMVWTYLIQDQKHGRQVLNEMKMSRPDKMRNTTLIAEMCRDLALAKDVSRWLRHRSKADCERYFLTTVNHTLNLRIPLAAVKGQQTRDVYMPAAFRTANELLRAIEGSVAKPLLDKMTNISESSLNDPHQNVVRPNWTEANLQTLQELVLKQKEGVFKADFQIDWSRVSKELESRSNEEDDVLPPALIELAYSTGKKKQRLLSPTPSKDEEAASTKATLSTPRYYSADQCRSCWEFLSAQPGRLRVQPSRRVAGADDNKSASSSAQKDDGWTDLEVMLLKQGIRRYGNNWADVRAQFLPARNVSDLQKKWKMLSVAAPVVHTSFSTSFSSFDSSSRPSSSSSLTDNTAAEKKIDRLSDPDYVGLLSALDKISVNTDGKGKKSM